MSRSRVSGRGFSSVNVAQERTRQFDGDRRVGKAVKGSLILARKKTSVGVNVAFFLKYRGVPEGTS